MIGNTKRNDWKDQNVQKNAESSLSRFPNSKAPEIIKKIGTAVLEIKNNAKERCPEADGK